MPRGRRRSSALRWLARAIALVLLCSLGGCYWRVAREPMPFLTYGDLGPQRARGVIVMLPGFGGGAEDFDEYGFVRVLRKSAPGFDLVAADAHFGYYQNNTLVDQLHKSVIGPLVARGYRAVWVVGVSMGGHGAIAYARNYPERIKGVLLFAPYLGPNDVDDSVSQAGGICRYTAPDPVPTSPAGYAEANFAWLRDVLCTTPGKVSVWVSVGNKDEGKRTLLRDAMEPDHYIVLPGGHDWDAWTPALERIAQTALGAN